MSAFEAAIVAFAVCLVTGLPGGGFTQTDEAVTAG